MFTPTWNLQGNQFQCLHQPGALRANNYYVYTSPGTFRAVNYNVSTSLEPSGQTTTMFTSAWNLQGNRLQCLHQPGTFRTTNYYVNSSLRAINYNVYTSLEPSGQPTTMFTAAWNLQGNQLQCLHWPRTSRATSYNVYTNLKPSGQPTSMFTPARSFQVKQLQFTAAWNLQANQLQYLHQPGAFRANNYYVYTSPGTFRAINYNVNTSLEPSGQTTTLFTPTWNLQGNQL